MKPETPVERFKRALGQATRSIAEEPELQVTYGAEPPVLRGKKARLPLPSRDLPTNEVAQIRGQADAYALRLHFHDEKTHQSYLPKGSGARAIFEAAEQVRIEAIGRCHARHRANLSRLNDAATRQGLRIRDRTEAPLSEAIALMMRERLTGRATPAARSWSMCGVRGSKTKPARTSSGRAHPR